MAQVFPRSANWASKASILAVLLIVASILGVVLNINRIYFINMVNVPIDQPVHFSHKHHVTGMGIDCRYCHTTVEVSAFAGIPPTETCMTCHSQIWNTSGMLEPVRASYRDGQPIRWVRVHDLPDFAYFNHSIHVKQGMGCSTCHGPVDQMPLMWRKSGLNMRWCLDCHRNPEQNIRPREEIFNMKWEPPANQLEMGRDLVAKYNVESKTSCSVCHR